MTWQTGRFPRLLRHINNAAGVVIEVGIVEPKTHTRSGRSLSMASLYRIHEEGTKHIPKRPTLRPGVKDKGITLAQVKTLVDGLVTGNYQGAYQQIGKSLAEAVRREIMQIKSPPLKPATIANRVKGGSNPLVDTGQLLRAVGYKVK